MCSYILFSCFSGPFTIAFTNLMITVSFLPSVAFSGVYFYYLKSETFTIQLLCLG